MEPNRPLILLAVLSSNLFAHASAFGPVVDVSQLDPAVSVALNGGSWTGAGRAVSHAGDVNADGVDDVLIGAAQFSNDDGIRTGRAYVVYGRAEGFPPLVDLPTMDASEGVVLSTAMPQLRVGFDVSSGGDFNGDGVDDLLLSARGFVSLDLLVPPKVYVVFGQSGGLPGIVNLDTLNGDNGFVVEDNAPAAAANLQRNYGSSVHTAGDVDDDGFDDIVIGGGITQDDQGVLRDTNYLMFGQASPLPAVVLAPDDPQVRFVTLSGFNLSTGAARNAWTTGAKDLNMDGIDDLAFGMAQ